VETPRNGDERGVAACGAWITYREAGRLTSLSRVTLWRAIKRGEIQVAKVGSAMRIHRRSLEEFMERRSLGRAAS